MPLPHFTEDVREMNDTLRDLIRSYPALSQSEFRARLNRMKKMELVTGMEELLAMYTNDSDSSALRRSMTALLMGFEPTFENTGDYDPWEAISGKIAEVVSEQERANRLTRLAARLRASTTYSQPYWWDHPPSPRPIAIDIVVSDGDGGMRGTPCSVFGHAAHLAIEEGLVLEDSNGEFGRIPELAFFYMGMDLDYQDDIDAIDEPHPLGSDRDPTAEDAAQMVERYRDTGRVVWDPEK